VDIHWITVFAISFPAIFFAGYYTAKATAENRIKRMRIEEYAFYPFITNQQGGVEFSQPLFIAAVNFFKQKRNSFATRQLIIIGEQNNVRDNLSTPDLNKYLSLYNKYDGDKLISENDRFMENYKRIVTLLGKSLRGTGIEILLHNLVNPTKSVIAIENGEVTGRKIEDGTTNLLLDLKTRKIHNQDKLNYELRIGARLFKCTTVPIFRKEFGLVGAVCINIDANFIRHEVMSQKEKMEAFIENIVRTDFTLNENILSKAEYKAALAGKRHFADDIFLSPSSTSHNKLMAILFSDIVNYTSLMGKDQQIALNILDKNRSIHLDCIMRSNGILLKEIGDGTLASFDSVSDAVKCGIAIQKKVKEDGGYQLRIGIHIGDVFTTGKDVFGDGVNIASRIQSQAQPGDVIVSEAVYNNIRNRQDYAVAFVEEKHLKNIEGTVKM
jgi:class 3 adenylate cyclase/predicted transcriptional regulator YheO